MRDDSSNLSISSSFENISIQILILNFPPIQKCIKAFEKFTNSNKFCQNQGQVKEILSYNKKTFFWPQWPKLAMTKVGANLSLQKVKLGAETINRIFMPRSRKLGSNFTHSVIIETV